MRRYRVSLQRLKRALSLGYERGDEYLERLQTKEERDVAREWIIATTNAAEGASSVNNTLVKGIAAYQMIMKLTVDGIAGPNTMRRLGLRRRKKKRSIKDLTGGQAQTLSQIGADDANSPPPVATIRQAAKWATNKLEAAGVSPTTPYAQEFVRRHGSNEAAAIKWLNDTIKRIKPKTQGTGSADA